ncbi:hypothetical protein [Haloferax sp. YSMS24]|uniref:hypothetical protein n=1 Tax=unclassified Haloferax TaxID=2625095 RepID=UPI00398D1A8D
MSGVVIPRSWFDPDRLATAVGVLAVGILYGYSASAESGLTTGDVTIVLVSVFVPMWVVRYLARRLW